MSDEVSKQDNEPFLRQQRSHANMSQDLLQTASQDEAHMQNLSASIGGTALATAVPSFQQFLQIHTQNTTGLAGSHTRASDTLAQVPEGFDATDSQSARSIEAMNVEEPSDGNISQPSRYGSEITSTTSKEKGKQKATEDIQDVEMINQSQVMETDEPSQGIRTVKPEIIRKKLPNPGLEGELSDLTDIEEDEKMPVAPSTSRKRRRKRKRSLTPPPQQPLGKRVGIRPFDLVLSEIPEHFSLSYEKVSDNEGGLHTVAVLSPSAVQEMGTNADSKLPKAIEDARKKYPGASFKAGHLLNADLGGPGDKAENLTILTSSANTTMTSFDNRVKEAGKELRKMYEALNKSGVVDIKTLDYGIKVDVSVSYDKPGKPGKWGKDYPDKYIANEVYTHAEMSGTMPQIPPNSLAARHHANILRLLAQANKTQIINNENKPEYKYKKKT